jgi:hypothetical protein
MRDESGKTWIPLDPSFKQYEYHEPAVNLTEAMGLNASAFLEGVMDNSLINESASYITSMNQSYIQEQMGLYTNSTLDYLEVNNMLNATLNDLLGYREIIPEELGILPASLPYKVIEQVGQYSEVPDDMRHKIKFEIYGNSTTLSMPELAGRRITLSYVPATENDAALIESYGGITNVPAYIVEMRPVLRVEGEAVAIGSADTLGETQQFVMEFQAPGGVRDRVANDVTVGAYYAVGLDLGKVPLRLIEDRKAKLSQWLYLNQESLVTDVNTDDIKGEILYTIAVSYFAELDLFNNIMAKTSGVTFSRLPSESIAISSLSVSYLFWSPYSVEYGGVGIDVDRNIYSVHAVGDDVGAEKDFMLKSGVMGSGLENTIFEQILGIEAISAVKIIRLANNMGIPIYRINASNVDEILPKLHVSDAVKSGIKSAVASGMIVTIPEREVNYYNWTGIGYIVLDPETGAGAYMISGGFAGGMTVLQCVFDVAMTLAAAIPGKIGKLLGYLGNFRTGWQIGEEGVNFAQVIVVIVGVAITAALVYLAYVGTITAAAAAIIGVSVVILLDWAYSYLGGEGTWTYWEEFLKACREILEWF